MVVAFYLKYATLVAQSAKMNFEYLRWIDILGTIAFAISGVFAAMHKKLDVFGVLIIAFVTAVGGGTIRDMMIGDLPASWMRDITYTLVIIGTTVVVILFRGVIRNFQKTLLVFDSIGLGLFTILGVQKGIAIGLHPLVCIALGTITGCFGGVVRDMLLNNIPVIFQREIYATACIIGGAVYLLLLHTHIYRWIVESIAIIVVFLIRMLAIHYDWRLPNIYRRNTNQRE